MMQYTPKLPDDSVNVSRQRPLLTAVKLTAALAVLALVGYLLMGAVIDLAVASVTPQQERKLASALSLDMPYRESNSSYLKQLTQRLTQCADLPYSIRVAVVKEKEPNAFAVPGGMIVITSGILSKMQSENELAFIIGHELGHFKHRDHLRALGYRIVLGAISLMLGSDYGAASSMTLGISSARYSQSAELAADRYGLEVMQCAYGTVSDATRIFEKMRSGYEWQYFMATHPGFETRIKQMRLHIRERGYDTTRTPLPLGKI